MGYRRTKNAHAVWVRLLAEAEPFIAESGLPRRLFAHEGRLVAFLTYGTCDDPPATLGGVGDDRFRSLERAVDILHSDSQDALGAFAAEQVRRFGRDGCGPGPPRFAGRFVADAGAGPYIWAAWHRARSSPAGRGSSGRTWPSGCWPTGGP